MTQLNCRRCGTPFEPRRTNQTFCSPICAVAQNRADTKVKRQAASRRYHPSICPGCEETFIPLQGKQRYCSHKCAQRIGTRLRKGSVWPSGVTRPCDYCETAFSSVDGRQKYCGEDCAKTAKSLREAFFRYGITMQQFRTIWLRQNGVCAICRQPERSSRNNLLCIDHDHVSGHIRGLLCSHCNRGIGLFEDDPKVIRAAAGYVERTRQIALLI